MNPRNSLVEITDTVIMIMPVPAARIVAKYFVQGCGDVTGEKQPARTETTQVYLVDGER